MPRGRPKGSKNKKTLEREARERELATQLATLQEEQQEERQESVPLPEKTEFKYVEFSKKYFKGQRYYYIYTNDFTGTKALLEIKIHTVKNNVLICNAEDDPSFICIGPEEENMIFTSYEEAKQKYRTITFASIFQPQDQREEGISGGEEQPKRKRGRPRKRPAT